MMKMVTYIELIKTKESLNGVAPRPLRYRIL